MKFKSLILLFLILTLALTDKAPSEDPPTSSVTGTEGSTTDDSKTVDSGEDKKDEATDGKPDENAGAGEGECTEKHCYYCSTDGENQWCNKCGNGMAINKVKGKDRKCDQPLKVENCREAPASDPTNMELCAKCQRGYGLDKSSGKCKKLELEGCTVPGMDDSGKIICLGCEDNFLLDDQSGCHDKEKDEKFGDVFPNHCMFGSKRKEEKCLMCGHNYGVSKTGKSCPEEMVYGCMMYHPNEPSKCLLCNTDKGFYSYKAVMEGDNVFQQCSFFSGSLGVLALVGFVVSLIGF